MMKILTTPKSDAKYTSRQVLEIVDRFLFTADTGFLIITIRDGYIFKMEKTAKYIITAKDSKPGYAKYGKPAVMEPFHKKIILEIQQIQYGQLVIHLSNGKVEQIEITEQKRVNEQGNLYSAGI